MKYLSDILIVIGEGLIVFGAYSVMPVAAVFTAGVLLIADGVMIGMAGGKVK